MTMFQSPFSAGQEVNTRVIKTLQQQAVQMAPWLKTLAFLLMFLAALLALSIVGLPLSWLPLTMGIVLYQAGLRAASLQSTGDPLALVQLMGRLKVYLVIALFGLTFSLMMLAVGVWYLTRFSAGEGAGLLSQLLIRIADLWP
ncbi:MAG TPA: DUF5362 family protein [Calditrichia bacterium]|nr:hypothetical protein [Calditrichota bacterium]HQU73255.1 DUF5362 family protein [Calditrichia bacterium]HQV33317.1 DUF5362 family protein [Calditrichia bacterium]